MINDFSLEDYESLFESADTDNDGFIDSKEFANLLASFKAKVPSSLINLIVKIFDKDNDGRLDFEEFLEMIEGDLYKFDTKEKLIRLFRVFDTTNTGTITKEDFSEIIKSFKTSSERRNLDEAVTEIDSNRDEKISFDEFVKALDQENLRQNEY